MCKITKTISINKSTNDIIQNIAQNFFQNNYSLAIEFIIKSADYNNIKLTKNGNTIDFHSAKILPKGINSIDLKFAPYNGNDNTFRSNCSNNFSITFQIALFKMIESILKYSYHTYNVYNINNKHFIGFRENVSLYQINTNGSLNHGIYINVLETLGTKQKTPKEYIQSNYYPIKDDRSFIFVSLPELNNMETDETIFISHLERFTRSNNFYNSNDLWNHIKISLGLCSSDNTSIPNHIEEYLKNQYPNSNLNFINKNIEALELSLENIYTIYDYFNNMLQ